MLLRSRVVRGVNVFIKEIHRRLPLVLATVKQYGFPNKAVRARRYPDTKAVKIAWRDWAIELIDYTLPTPLRLVQAMSTWSVKSKVPTKPKERG